MVRPLGMVVYNQLKLQYIMLYGNTIYRTKPYHLLNLYDTAMIPNEAPSVDQRICFTRLNETA